jgi:hypothetical protein
VVLAGFGCADTGLPEVVDAREMPGASWDPKVSRVRDAGGVPVPFMGGWFGEPDGVAHPGEVVLIEGSDFGRLPTVSIGGRAAQVLARTEGGGIVTRVPTGTPVGDVDVSVSHPKGRGSAKLKVRRLAMALHDGRAWALEVGRDGAQLVGQPLHIAGGRRVRLSSDGGAAYVLSGDAHKDRIVIIDLCAPHAPKAAGEIVLGHRGVLIAAADRAPLFVAAGEGRATFFTTDHARRPQPVQAVPLPKELAPARAIALSPDGKLLAGLIPDGNKLVVLEVSKDRRAVRMLTQVELLPGEKLQLARDLAFSSDGETLWVVSGDNEASLPALVPTRLTAVRLLPEDKNGDKADKNGDGKPDEGRVVSVWRTQSVPGASAPLRIAVARGQPTASGTTIRMPPDKAAVFASSVNDALFKLADIQPTTPQGAQKAYDLWHPERPGQIVRCDINGGGGPLFQAPQILSAIDLTPDAQLLLATSARLAASPPTGGVHIEFGVTASPVWGTPTPTFIPLGPLPANQLRPPFDFGDLRIQP